MVQLVTYEGGGDQYGVSRPLEGFHGPRDLGSAQPSVQSRQCSAPSCLGCQGPGTGENTLLWLPSRQRPHKFVIRSM